MLVPFDTVFDSRESGVVNGERADPPRDVACRARPSDIFLGVASTGILTIGPVNGSFSTPSPDPTVAGLTVVIAWRVLAAGEGKPAVASLVPLLLACGALNLKLSGLWLLPVVGLYAVCGASLRRWIVIAHTAALCPLSA